MAFKQGYYTPNHPEKYMGDVTKIRYMSSYEFEMHKFLDNNPNVIRWGSEEVVVPYVKPTTGKVHRYYVDYVVEYVNKHGEVITELIEVKPASQTRPTRSRKPQNRLYEQLQYAVNTAKWQAAIKFAESKGWKFRIVTENGIFR